MQIYPVQVANLVLCPLRYSSCLVTFWVPICYGYIYSNQYLMHFPFPWTIVLIWLSIDSMVFFTVSSGIECSVSLTAFEYSSKFSLIMFLLKALACNISFVMLNIFSRGFMLGLRSGMKNISASMLSSATLAFLLFWHGSPSCQKGFCFEFALFSNVLSKCSKINYANISPLIFPWDCSQNITPQLNAIATKKCATLPPEPTWLPFAVQFKSKPSLFFLQVIVRVDFASSKGLCLCWKLAPSK